MSKHDSMLREVKVEDAIGMILPHDLTQILPGEFKGRLFRKGHQVTEADIPALLSIGKEHIYVMELQPGYLHEDEAALRMAKAIAGDGLLLTEPHEGKVNVKSAIHGLVKIDKAFVDSVNAIDEVVLSTIRSNTVVQAGASLVGTRVIPLIVDEAKVVEVERLAAARREMGFTLLEVKPFRKLRVGVITTGSEVFKGRIKDKFGPVVKEKLAQLGSEVVDQRFVSDDSEAIVGEIHALLALGVDLVLVTGGMSVDPDDRTPGAIKMAGARVVSYGTPMLPGSMLMIAYLGDVPIMGLPGCVMHDPYTSFDVLLPRICAGETIVRSDITEMGYGGFYQC
ncbi:molybdopterin-binding protein [Paenibacillus alginolyticus]|uniref:Molybdopterin molybdenumtransferase n=1 Tax=Paenibacillus alginolyticus TaxID=59839 RepID=A0ABT4G8P4_9BACL|nr:molybdopterin-binding protein [Paenibacillus alginolyticus]MCY9692532.1 molybdopterin-binding protein [Paenibacillus alginolyticus]MEC0143737.1 molybdopterin-binding protein [Paenibacillus alginolyticus]